MTEPIISTRHSVIPKSIDGLSVAGLVFGVLALWNFWLFPFCAIFAATSFVLGGTAKRRMAEFAIVRKDLKTWVNIGFILSISGLLLSVVLNVSCFFVAKKYAQEGKKSFAKSIQELEEDPEFEKRIKELNTEMKNLGKNEEK